MHRGGKHLSQSGADKPRSVTEASARHLGYPQPVNVCTKCGGAYHQASECRYDEAEWKPRIKTPLQDDFDPSMIGTFKDRRLDRQISTEDWTFREARKEARQQQREEKQRAWELKGHPNPLGSNPPDSAPEGHEQSVTTESDWTTSTSEYSSYEDTQASPSLSSSLLKSPKGKQPERQVQQSKPASYERPAPRRKVTFAEPSQPSHPSIRRIKGRVNLHKENK